MVEYGQNHTAPGQGQSSNNAGQYMSQHRSSPHLSHLDHTDSHPSTPSPPYPQYAQPMMSQPPGQSRQQQSQPTSYPSPHSYPSPSMPAYSYPPPQQQQTVEPYRSSPTSSHLQLPGMINLPPIRSLGQQQAAPAPAGPQMPPSQVQMTPYPQYSLPPPPQHMNVTSSPHPQPLRYPLPAADGRIMSGGRHKKEIKRRTKTGCLTCRKRRIKCDERHPICKNCEKSKRDCLGYDPIFKAQAGPAAIQPAPTSAQSVASSSSDPAPTAASPYPQNASAPTSAPSYPLSASYPPPAAANYVPALSTGESSPGSSVEPYEYATAIDPALEAAAPSQNASEPAAPYNGRADLKRGLDRTSPFSSSAASDAQGQKGGETPVEKPGVLREKLAHLGLPAKRIKIDDLLSVGGGIPPPPTPPLSENAAVVSPESLDDIKNEYSANFAPAIDSFLETTWFSKNGLPRVLSDGRLVQYFANYIATFGCKAKSEGQEANEGKGQSEARIIWTLLRLCQGVAATSEGHVNGSHLKQESEEVSEDDLPETAQKIAIVENLISGGTLEANPLSSANGFHASLPEESKVKARGTQFWHLLGKFVTLRDDEASAAREIDDTLSASRELLDGLENRDVLYSIAIARHLGQRIGEADNVTEQGDEVDSKMSDLNVAKTLVVHESTSVDSNVVMKTMCGMAIKTWPSHHPPSEAPLIFGIKGEK